MEQGLLFPRAGRRVHCKREAFDEYCGRPSKWGNLFSHKPGTLARWRVSTRAEAVAKHRAWVLSQPDLVTAIKRELKGKTLGCWCGPRQECHCDVYLEIVNE